MGTAPAAPREETAGSASGKRRRRSRLISVVQAALGVAVLGWLLLSGAIDWRALAGLLTAGWVLPVTACLCLGNFAFAAWRLRVLMEAQDLRLPFMVAFRLSVTAVFFSWCIPGGTGGDLVKMYFLGRWNPGRVTEAVTITLWDRAIGLATFLILALGAAAFAPRLVMSEPILAALLAACAVLLLMGAAALALALHTDWSRRWPLARLERFGRPGRTVIRIFHVVHGYRRRPMALLAGIGLSLCAQACLLGGLLALATVVAEGGARPIMLVLMPMGTVTNALPITPGGLGVGEAAFEELFRLAGLSGGADVSLSWRAVAMVMSLPGMWFYLRYRSVICGTAVPPVSPRPTG